jgi:hypothetical protein
MIALISRAIVHLGGILQGLQVKRFLGVVLLGFLLVTTNVTSERDNSLTTRVDKALEQNDSQRPKTTGEWNKEARETANDPGKRLQKIAGESAEAVKDFGSLYPDTLKRSAPNLGNK